MQSNLKLLMIEDDADQRELAREVLEDHFGKGTVTCVGCKAETLREDLDSFDLILSDHNLPDCSGMDLMKEIRARSTTPIIMVTGENSGEMAAEAIRKGATDYVVKVKDYMFNLPLVVEKNLTAAKLRQENDSLRDSLQKALADVQQTNQQLEKSLLRVEEMAATDPLTGLYNRRHFGKVLDQLFSEAQRYGQPMSVSMIDLDGYKQLNDSCGHQVGDQLLMLAGKVISSNMRRMDVAARYGGDEFVLLLPHADAAEAAGVAERIRGQFKQASAQLLKRAVGISMSIGIAEAIDTAAPTADLLVAAADTALYQSKQAGRDRISLATTLLGRVA